jgi:host factor-I protein
MGRRHEHDSGDNGAPAGPPPVMTEAEYLQKLAREMKPVVVHLRSGEVFRGSIEYYDQRFIRLTRQGEANLFIFKHDIKYFYEE